MAETRREFLEEINRMISGKSSELKENMTNSKTVESPKSCYLLILAGNIREASEFAGKHPEFLRWRFVDSVRDIAGVWGASYVAVGSFSRRSDAPALLSAIFSREPSAMRYIGRGFAGDKGGIVVLREGETCPECDRWPGEGKSI